MIKVRSEKQRTMGGREGLVAKSLFFPDFLVLVLCGLCRFARGRIGIPVSVERKKLVWRRRIQLLQMGNGVRWEGLVNG